MVRGLPAARGPLPSAAHVLHYFLLLFELTNVLKSAAFLHRLPCSGIDASYDSHQQNRLPFCCVPMWQQLVWAGGGVSHPRGTCSGQPHVCPQHPMSRHTRTRCSKQHAHVPSAGPS